MTQGMNCTGQNDSVAERLLPRDDGTAGRYLFTVRSHRMPSDASDPGGPDNSLSVGEAQEVRSKRK